MTPAQEQRNMRAKLKRRDKRIEELTQENITARRLLREAIVKVEMLSRENMAMKANAKVLATDKRVAQQLENLRYAEDILGHFKAHFTYQKGFIENYEEHARKTL